MVTRKLMLITYTERTSTSPVNAKFLANDKPTQKRP